MVGYRLFDNQLNADVVGSQVDVGALMPDCGRAAEVLQLGCSQWLRQN